MAMSKKDYERIAAEVRRTIHAERLTSTASWAHGMREGMFEFTGNLAQSFAEDNPRFDRARFLKACGIGEE